MRRRVSWALALPLALTGSFAGHEVGYRVAASNAHERAHLLERSGHAYIEYAPLAAGAALALLLVGFAALVARLARGDSGGRLPVWAGAVLPPLVFLLQEHVERFLYHGSFAWDTLLQPAVLFGLLLQAPAALFVIFVATSLTRLAVRAAGAFTASTVRRRVTLGLWRPAAIDLPRLSVVASGHAGRGPPAAL